MAVSDYAKRILQNMFMLVDSITVISSKFEVPLSNAERDNCKQCALDCECRARRLPALPQQKLMRVLHRISFAWGATRWVSMSWRSSSNSELLFACFWLTAVHLLTATIGKEQRATVLCSYPSNFSNNYFVDAFPVLWCALQHATGILRLLRKTSREERPGGIEGSREALTFSTIWRVAII